MMTASRHTAAYLVLAAVTTASGLLSRSDVLPLPDLIRTYAGDTLWAMMAFWTLRILRPQAATWHLAVAAMGTAFAVEFSQFYHAPWIDRIRGYRLGGLLLGFGFKASDLLCYSIGVAAASIIDRPIHRSAESRKGIDYGLTKHGS